MRAPLPRGMLGGLIRLMASTLFLLADGQGEFLLIQNARLIERTGAAPRPGRAILSRGGCIAAIGSNVIASDAPVLDAGSATVLPGAVDAHVHVGVVPGAGQRHDPPALERDLRHAEVRARG